MRKLLQLLVYVVLIACVNLFALTSGPTQPEYSSFEPVDATDMVDLGTGDFTYVLPLGEVQSPSGVGYPITLSYHAGILHEQEATWVGLGWNLNAGAINRTVRGFPDDLCGEATLAYLYDDGDNGWDLSFGGGWKYFEATSTVSYSSSKGYTLYPLSSISFFGGGRFGGVSAGVSFTLDWKNEVGSVGLNLGVYGESAGANASIGVTTNGDIYGGIGVAANNRHGEKISSANFGLSSKNSGVGVSFNGLNNSSSGGDFSKNGVSSYSAGFFCSYQIPVYDININFGWTEWSWYFSQLQYGECYGYLYQGVNGNDDPDINSYAIETNNEQLLGLQFENVIRQNKINNRVSLPAGMDTDIQYIYPKYEYADIEGFSLPLQDNYSVVGQGIGGVFMPMSFASSNTITSDSSKYNGLIGKPNGVGDGSFTNRFKFNESDLYNRYNDKTLLTENFNNNGDITFKMMNEYSGNMKDNLNDNYSEESLFSTFGEDVQGTKITPIIGNEKYGLISSKLKGFIIRDQEGKTYYYTYPLYSLSEFNYTNDENEVPKVEDSDIFSTSEGTHSYSVNLSPFAYTWLLTGVTGPDYIKNLNSEEILNGESKLIPEKNDFGYWVRFNYEYGNVTSWDVTDEVIEIYENDPTLTDPEIEAKRRLSENVVLDKAKFKWMMPYYDRSFSKENLPHYSDECNSDQYSSSFGVKEITYLKSIETANEIAYFRTSERKDGKGTDNNSFPSLFPTPITWPVASADIDLIEHSSFDYLNVSIKTYVGKTGFGLIKKGENDHILINNNMIKVLIPTNKLSSQKFFELPHGEVILSVDFEGKGEYEILTSIFKDRKLKKTFNSTLTIRKDKSGCNIPDDYSTCNQWNSGWDISKDRAILEGLTKHTNISGAGADHYAKCFFAKDLGDGYTELWITGYVNQSIIGEKESINSPWHSGDIRIYFPETYAKILPRLYNDNWNNPLDEVIQHARPLGGLLSGTFSSYGSSVSVRSQKKLDEIVWYSKNIYPYIDALIDPEDEDYSGSGLLSPKPYKNVLFNYDYTLARSTPNSYAPQKGRLTLKSVTTGTGDMESEHYQMMPPFIFSYQNPGLHYLGQGEHDPWGFREGDNINDPQAGIAWNLSQITYPSGGNIHIEYERDQANSEVSTFLKMKDKCLDDRKQFVLEDTPGEYYQIKNIVNPDTYGGEKSITLSDVNNIKVGDHFSIRVEEKEKVFEIDPSKDDINCDVTGDSYYYSFYSYMFNSFEVIGINQSSNTIYIDAPIHDWENYQEFIDDIRLNGTLFEKKTEAWFYNKGDFYGGDLRVVKISTENDLNVKKSILYEYSEGYFPNLAGTLAPSNFTANDTFMLISSNAIGHFNYNAQPEWGNGRCYCTYNYGDEGGGTSKSGNIIYINHISRKPFQSFVGSTTRMLYPQVKISSVNNDNNSIVGSTIHNFYSKYDLISINGETEKPIIEYSTLNGSYGSSSVKVQKIINRSSIVGVPKKVEKYKDGDMVNPIFVKEMEYAFSDELASKASVYNGEIENKITSGDNKPLGLIQERTIRREKESEYAVTAITDVVNSKPFLIGTKETADGVSTEIRYGMFNAKTGKPSLTIIENSEGEKKAQVEIPYSSMSNIPPDEEEIIKYKNTYSLPGGSFTVDVTDLSYTNLGDITYSDLTRDVDNIKQASTGLYYFDTYEATDDFVVQQARCWVDTSLTWKGKDASSTSFTFPTPGVAVPSNWQITSIIDKTDRNARAICGSSPNSQSGKFTSSTVTYHPNMSAVTGVISNADYKEASVYNCNYVDYITSYAGENSTYLDAESKWCISINQFSGLEDPKVELSDNESIFGDYSIYVKNAIGVRRNFRLKEGRDYILSAWVKPVAPLTPSKGDMIHVDYRRNAIGSTGWPIELKSSLPIGGETPKNCTGNLEVIPKEDGWYYVEMSIPFTKDLDHDDHMDGWFNAYVAIGAPNGGEVYINDIRFYPEDAIVKTFYYDQELGVPVTFVDENNKVKRFEYDGFARLKNIQNNSSEILSETEYSLGSGAIIITNPTGAADEYFDEGSNMAIQWKANGKIENVKIELSVDGGETYAYDVGTDNTINVGGANTFDYTVPTGIRSSDCVIRITELNTKTVGFSNKFNIDVSSIPNVPLNLDGPSIVWFVPHTQNKALVKLTYDKNNLHRDVVYKLYEKSPGATSFIEKMENSAIAPNSFDFYLNYLNDDVGDFVYKIKAIIGTNESTFSNEHTVEFATSGTTTGEDCPCVWDSNLSVWRNENTAVIGEDCGACTEADK